jgi:hypothetical protein
LTETGSDKARWLREDFRNAIRDLLAPDIFAVECAHALTKGERRGVTVDPDFLHDEIMLDAPRFSPSTAHHRTRQSPEKGTYRPIRGN